MLLISTTINILQPSCVCTLQLWPLLLYSRQFCLFVVNRFGSTFAFFPPLQHSIGRWSHLFCFSFGLLRADGFPSFLPDDACFFEVLFEARIIEVANQVRIFEGVIGRQKHLVDMLGGHKVQFFYFVVVPAHGAKCNVWIMIITRAQKCQLPSKDKRLLCLLSSSDSLVSEVF